jgi:hypothetical protein
MLWSSDTRSKLGGWKCSIVGILFIIQMIVSWSIYSAEFNCNKL